MRKLTYYVAGSVDGFIAHEDGTWGGFLTEDEHLVDTGSCGSIIG